MITVIFIVIFAAITVYALYLHNNHKNADDFSTAIITWLACTIACIFILLFSTISVYHNQIRDIEELRVIDDRIELYKKRSFDIAEPLRDVLVNQYKEHELDVIENMSGVDGLQFYFVKYPELHSHETFMSYSQTLKSLMDDYYRLKYNKITINKRIAQRLRYLHILRFTIPKE